MSPDRMRELAPANNWSSERFAFEQDRVLEWLKRKLAYAPAHVPTISEISKTLRLSQRDLVVIGDDLSAQGIISMNVAIGGSGGYDDLPVRDWEFELFDISGKPQ